MSLRLADPARVDTGFDRAPILLEQGITLSVLGRLREAIAAFVEGLASTEEPRLRGHLLVQLARAETQAGDPEQALEHATEAGRLAAAVEDPRGLAMADRVAGDAARKLGRLDEAARLLARGLATAERVGSAEELGACLLNLGLVEMDREDWPAAQAALAGAVAEFHRAGNRNGEVFAASAVADAAQREGRYADAVDLAGRACQLARTAGNEPVLADTLDTLANARLALGDAAGAATDAEAASEAYAAVEEPSRAADLLELAAEAWSRAGETERARDRRSRARALREGVAAQP